ncbi:GGDEF domain-containing protein [Bacillus massiliigorillae]|uniref:GGDEF domain-containing protein n=1 Tax=Bacillus massiliigorillae TaxID=1243664 RepID=UPI00039E4C75|nr:GGDEF domain-containing protein [Bacillus massiliigorillae]
MTKKENNWEDFLRGSAVDRCAVEVLARNNRNLRAFSILGIIMMSFAIIFGWLMRDIFTFSTEFIVMWVYFLVMYLFNRFTTGNIKRVTTVFYLWIIPIMIIGIIMGTFGDPKEPSITIMVFLCVLPMFILDKPWRIVLFILMNSVVYTICCYMAKTTELFMADMIDLILFTVLGVGVNCLILQDRINNVEYAMEMRLIAETDALTELNNRGAGEEKVRQLMRQGKSGMLLLIDVDNFKDVNDRYGHLNGDNVLKSVSLCLRQSFRDNDVGIRFGGDEFMIFAQSLENQEDGRIYIDRIIQKIRRLSIPDMPEYHFSVSIGAAFFQHETHKSFETIYREADEALYQAKRSGKDSYSFSQDT